ncbi:hypothetical protein WJX72_009088 [[Myrmecia] bisecta]|uniref:Myb-like domain-containing protein n=1 Tax=[Myrmecia] bisecta TaxID=41462 RepID=A0AAW1Q1P3_9CHLO
MAADPSATAGASEQGKAPRNGSIRYYVLGADKPYVALELLEQALIGGTSTPAPFAGGKLRGVQLHVQALALLAARLLAVGEKDAGMQLLEPGGRATTSTDATGTGRAASAGGAALTGKQPKGRAITYYVVDAQGTDKLHIGLELLHRAVCERNGLGPRHGSKSIRLPSASTADHILRACCDSKDAGLLLKAASTAENLGICHVELHTETIAMLAARLFAIGHVDDGLRLLNVCAGQQATAQHSFEAADGYAARISGRPDLQQALADAHVIHQQLRATGGLPDIDFQSTYMLLAATCGEPATVDMLWKELQRVGLALNAAAYHAIILCRSETSSAWAASLLTDMRKAVPKLDQASSCHLLFATLHARQIHAGSAIWAQMAEQGVQPSWLAYAAYLTALLQAGKHAAPFEILARLGERFRAARDEVGGATLPPGEELMAPNPPWPLHLPSSADLASLFQHLICRVVSMPVIPSRRRHVLRELIKEMGRSRLLSSASTGSSVDQLRADVGNTRRLHSPGSERAGGTPAHDVEQHDLDASALSATGNHEAGQWRAFDSLLTTLGRTSFAAGDAREAGMSAAAAGKGSAGRPQAQQTWQTDQKKKQLQWPGAIVNLEVCSVLAGGLVAKGHAAHAFEVYSCHRQARGQVSASLLHIMMWAAINSPLDTRRRNIVRIAEDMQRGFPAASQPFWPMPMHNAIWDAFESGPGKQPRKWWTFEELDVLTKLVKQNGARDWKAVLEKGQAQGVFKGRKAADICGKWHSWTSNGVPTLHSEHVVDRD